jgi:hypothetical protein
MPYVKIKIPDGEKCKNFSEHEVCRFQPRGTVCCELFGELLAEIDDYTNLQKCARCLALNNQNEDEVDG